MCPLPLRPQTRTSGAFTLIELLTVVGVIVVMMALAIPAFNAIRGGSDFTSELYDISGVLDQARAYAMSNNTYVLVGIAEVSAAQDSAVNPQVTGTGRITMAVVASKTGVRPYDVTNANNLKSWTASGYVSGSVTHDISGAVNGGFIPVAKLLQFANIHLVDLQSESAQTSGTSGSGGMERPAVPPTFDIPNTSCTCAIWLAWPLGTRFKGTPTPQYQFLKVIEFDPQGSARIISATNLATIPKYIEIGLQPSQGIFADAVPADQSHGQQAAIQIDGMSGMTTVFRP